MFCFACSDSAAFFLWISAVERLSRDGTTRWKPTNFVQETLVKATSRNSGESNIVDPIESEFQPPITSIIDVPYHSNISLAGNEFLCQTFSDSFSSCINEHTAAHLEEPRLYVQPRVQDCLALDAQNENVSKNVYKKKNTSASGNESASNNNRLERELTNYSLHETISEAKEVKLCSSDPHQPDGMRSSPLNQTSQGPMNDLDQAVSKSQSDKESSTVISLLSELHQIPGATSAKSSCHVSSKTGHGSDGERPINCAQENTCIIPRSLSQPDSGITQVPTAVVCGDGSESLDLCRNPKSQKPSAESKTSVFKVGSHSGVSDFNRRVLDDNVDLKPVAMFTFTKTSSLKPLEDSDCPAKSDKFKHQLATGPPKSKVFGIPSINKAPKELQQKVFRSESPITSDRPDQFTKFHPIAIISSFLNSNKQLNASSCHELSSITDRMHIAAQHGLCGDNIETIKHSKEKNVGSKSVAISQEEPCPSITHRTFIELQLSLASGFISPLFKHSTETTWKPTKDYKSKTYASLASKLSPLSRGETPNDIPKGEGFDSLHYTEKAFLTVANGSKPSQTLVSGETLKLSTSKANGQTVVRQSLSRDVPLSTDYKPFSVRHKIKSFESLANLEKPVAKSSDVQTFAVAYTASVNQRIAGYIDSVNSVDWRGHQRNNGSYNNCLTSIGSLSPPLGRSAEIEDPKAKCGTTSHTPLVLRRKHGRLPTRKVHQLRTLSMPNLDKLCKDDFRGGNDTAVNQDEPRVCLPIATKVEVIDCCSPTATRSCANDGSSECNSQGPPETRRSGWSIR